MRYLSVATEKLLHNSDCQPEEIFMNITNSYEHEGEFLSEPIIRDLLENHLTFTTWSTGKDIGEKVEEYHSQKGGGGNRLKDYNTSVYNALHDLIKDKTFEKYQEGHKNYYRLR